MAEYLIGDRDKAAFINKMNKIFGEIKPGSELSSSNFMNIPGEMSIFLTTDPMEEKLLDTLVKKRTFSYPVKKISLKEMIEASREQV